MPDFPNDPDDNDDYSSGYASGSSAEPDAAGNAPANTKIEGSIQAAPMYRDGLTSTLTYLIMAVRKNTDEYNCICQGNGKIKFYPSPEYFNVEESDLELFGIDTSEKRQHHGYVRYMCDRQTAAKLLEHVATVRGTISISPNMLLTAPPNGKNTLPRRGQRGAGKAMGFPSPSND